jgi:hypothetical protein
MRNNKSVPFFSAMRKNMRHFLPWRQFRRMYQAATVLLLMCLLVMGCSDDKTKRLRQDHFTHDGEKVHFRLGSTKLGEDFTVYKSYLRGSSQSRWGILNDVRFVALLPNFETYDKEKNHYEFVERLGHGRRLEFHILRRGSGRVSLPEVFKGKVKNDFGRYYKSIGKYNELKYGLEVYRSITHWDDQYLYRPNGEIKVIIGCSSAVANHPSPGCKMYWDHSEFVYADATFSLDYLPQWREILSNMEKVLSGQKLNIQGAVNGTQNQ